MTPALAVLFPVLLRVAQAQQQQPVDLPLQATVSCPPLGVCRIPVPPAMTARGPRYALYDALGHLVPSTRLSAAEAPDRWVPLSLVPAVSAPDGSKSFRLSAPPEPGPLSLAAVRLRLTPAPRLPDLDAVAQARHRAAPDARWQSSPRLPLAAPSTLLPLAVPLLQDLEVQTNTRVHLAAAEAGVVSPDRVSIGAAKSLGDGWWDVAFTEAIPLDALTLEGAGTEVSTVEVSTWGAGAAGTIGLTSLGQFDVRQHTLSGLGGGAARRLVLRTAPTVALTRVRAWSPPDVLLVRDGGEMTLYGGAVGEAHQPLRDSAQTLLSLPWVGAAVGPALPNPAATGSGWEPLLLPGSPTEPQRFLFRRSLSGQGLVFLSLPEDVMLQVRPDLGDLRIIDDQDRQLPYVVVALPGWQDTTLSAEVKQLPGETHLQVALPRTGLSGLRLSLTSSARGFSRSVRLLDGSGREVARKTWQGDTASLTFSIETPTQDTLEVVVINGDDPPIPVTLAVAVQQRGVVVQIPTEAGVGGSAWLVYGDRSVQPEGRGARLGRRSRPRLQPIPAPDYDLRNVAGELMRAAAGEGRLGPPADILIGGEARDQQELVLMATLAAAVALLLLLARALLLSTPPRPPQE